MRPILRAVIISAITALALVFLHFGHQGALRTHSMSDLTIIGIVVGLLALVWGGIRIKATHDASTLEYIAVVFIGATVLLFPDVNDASEWPYLLSGVAGIVMLFVAAFRKEKTP